MIVTLNVSTLLVGALASIWFTLSVLSINAALTIRILLGEESEKGSTTSLSLHHADHNGNGLQLRNGNVNSSNDGSELLERNSSAEVVKTSGLGLENESEALTLRSSGSKRDIKNSDGPATPAVELSLPILSNKSNA